MRLDIPDFFRNFQWFGVFLAIPALYLLTIPLYWVLSPLVASIRRRARKSVNFHDVEIVPSAVRFLLIAFVIYGLLSGASLALVTKQFWATMASLPTIVACVWLVILLNGNIEERIGRRLACNGSPEAATVIRLGRGMADLLAILVGFVVCLYNFGLHPSAAMAGLGIGGIAVAIAAQNTLENLLAGISMMFDPTLRVGDTVKLGSTLGIIEDVGLRSTRIRALDRTIVVLPNVQFAIVSLENLSRRDKFWFHPTLSLRYDTTATQMQFILKSLRDLLKHDPHVESNTAVVRFLRFGIFSLDVEISAYVMERNPNAFLEIQGGLLLRVMEIVQTAGAQIAPESPIYESPYCRT